jgi:hypothetical protein
VTAAVIASALAGCAAAAPTAHRAGAGNPAGPTRAGASQVCARFAVAALSADTAVDSGPGNARQRAAVQFGTANLNQQITGQGNDPVWSTLVAHQADVTVTTTPITDDPPPAIPGQAAAGVIAHQTALGSAGWRLSLPDTVVYCTLTATGVSWKVDAVTFTDDGTAQATP